MGDSMRSSRRRRNELETQSALIAAERQTSEDALKREREKAQRMFMRQVRARQAGGFLSPSTKSPFNETLG